jgi:hypothetical protein
MTVHLLKTTVLGLYDQAFSVRVAGHQAFSERAAGAPGDTPVCLSVDSPGFHTHTWLSPKDAETLATALSEAARVTVVTSDTQDHQ